MNAELRMNGRLGRNPVRPAHDCRGSPRPGAVTVAGMVDTSSPEFETQREPVPRVDTGELDTALAFLDFVRSCVLKKAAGLTEEQLRRAVVPSGTSILGLIQHLSVGERFWFGYQLTGIGDDADFDFDMVVPPERSGAEVIQDYRAAIQQSNELIRRIGDPQAPVAVPIDGECLSLRWVIAHATGETTRHAGHADIIRELIDGVTGR
jgi:Protein of unknown function (DUF664)